MKITFSSVACILLSAGFLHSQVNPALPEGPELLDTNPAGLAFENQSGVGGFWIWDGATLQVNHIEVLGRYTGYNYQWTPQGVTHTLGFGAGWGPDMIAGGLSWTNIVGETGTGYWKYGLASRPLPFLSLGITGEGVSLSGVLTKAGIGLRPLAFWPSLQRMVSLDAAGSWDWKLNGPLFPFVLNRVGVTLRPFDGLSIAGFWNPTVGTSFSLEAALWTENLRTSYQTPQVAPTDGKASVWFSSHPRESIFKASSPSVVRAPVPSFITEWPEAGWFGQRGSNWRQVQEDLLQLGRNPSVKTVVFDQPLQFASGALAWEFGKTLQVLRSKGKKIHWYLEQPTLASYVVAAWTGDELVLTPTGSLLLTGLGNQQLYWKDFLAGWGIKFHNLKISPYKAAYDTLSESGRSPEDRATWEGLLKEWQNILAQALSDGRKDKLTAPALDLIAQGPYWDAQEALDKGLIDRVAYKDEFLKDLGLDSGFLMDPLLHGIYQNPSRDNWSRSGMKKIALIWFSGDILGAQGNRDPDSGYLSLAAALRTAGEDGSIQGVVVRLDSPGGSMLASDLIAREITLIRNRGKPVYVSMAGVAGSGGYYISAAADKIFATPLTLTGSIGVVSLIPDFTGLLAKQGIQSDLVAGSPNAGLGNPFLPFDAEQEKTFRKGISGAYEFFLNYVSREREIKREDLEPLAGGRLWSARGALEVKLIDEVGGLAETLDAMRNHLGGGDVEIQDISAGTSVGFAGLLDSLTPRIRILPPPFDTLTEKYERLEALGSGKPLFWLDTE